MKKMMTVVLVALFTLSFSAVILADVPGGEGDYLPPWAVGEGIFENWNEHGEDEGVVVSYVTGDYYNVEGLPMQLTDQHLDERDPDFKQSTTATVTAKAYIPCYLSMEIIGNRGKIELESFGPNADAEIGPSAAHFLAFDNELGGFVDEDWNSIGHGQNAEIRPGDNVYIQGCDIFRAVVYANDKFRYQVQSDSLLPTSATSGAVEGDAPPLPLQMRTSNEEEWDAGIEFDGTAVTLGEGFAGETITRYHQFRVPYSTSTVHGEYLGEVIFKAFTL